MFYRLPFHLRWKPVQQLELCPWEIAVWLCLNFEGCHNDFAFQSVGATPLWLQDPTNCYSGLSGLLHLVKPSAIVISAPLPYTQLSPGPCQQDDTTIPRGLKAELEVLRNTKVAEALCLDPLMPNYRRTRVVLFCYRTCRGSDQRLVGQDRPLPDRFLVAMRRCRNAPR